MAWQLSRHAWQVVSSTNVYQRKGTTRVAHTVKKWNAGFRLKTEIEHSTVLHCVITQCILVNKKGIELVLKQNTPYMGINV